MAELLSTKDLQLEFWEGFGAVVEASTFSPRKPAGKNWYPLALGTSRARIVLGIHLNGGRVDCKLAPLHGASKTQDLADIVYTGLSGDRSEIESQLGFSDLVWGDPTPTRIYRSAVFPVTDRASWDDAYEWLITSAEGFKQAFAPRIGQMTIPGTDAPKKTFAAVNKLVDWSSWVPIDRSRESAPRLPGVYMVRSKPHGPVVYVGMAGERSARGTKKPQGINGRLGAYLNGQSLGGGLLGRCFDLALRNPEWLRERAAEIDAGAQPRAKDWGKAALKPHDLYVRWATCEDSKSARKLESDCLVLLKDAGLWNFQD